MRLVGLDREDDSRHWVSSIGLPPREIPLTQQESIAAFPKPLALLQQQRPTTLTTSFRAPPNQPTALSRPE